MTTEDNMAAVEPLIGYKDSNGQAVAFSEDGARRAKALAAEAWAVASGLLELGEDESSLPIPSRGLGDVVSLENRFGHPVEAEDPLVAQARHYDEQLIELLRPTDRTRKIVTPHYRFLVIGSDAGPSARSKTVVLDSNEEVLYGFVPGFPLVDFPEGYRPSQLGAAFSKHYFLNETIPTDWTSTLSLNELLGTEGKPVSGPYRPFFKHCEVPGQDEVPVVQGRYAETVYGTAMGWLSDLGVRVLANGTSRKFIDRDTSQLVGISEVHRLNLNETTAGKAEGTVVSALLRPSDYVTRDLESPAADKYRVLATLFSGFRERG